MCRIKYESFGSFFSSTYFFDCTKLIYFTVHNRRRETWGKSQKHPHLSPELHPARRDVGRARQRAMSREHHSIQHWIQGIWVSGNDWDWSKAWTLRDEACFWFCDFFISLYSAYNYASNLSSLTCSQEKNSVLLLLFMSLEQMHSTTYLKTSIFGLRM